jgi:CRP-like cAMP-binding protein
MGAPMAAYTDPVISKHGRSIPAGTLIYREGAPAEEVFILQRGSVRLCTSVRGEEFCLAELADGDLFGDEVLGARRRQSSALAVRDVEAVVVDASTFLRILDESREVRRRIVDKLASRLQETTARLVRQVAQGDTSRLASVLQGGGGSSPEDLAGRAGLLPSRSALLLDRLQRAGLISEGRWAA